MSYPLTTTFEPLLNGYCSATTPLWVIKTDYAESRYSDKTVGLHNRNAIRVRDQQTRLESVEVREVSKLVMI